MVVRPTFYIISSSTWSSPDHNITYRRTHTRSIRHNNFIHNIIVTYIYIVKCDTYIIIILNIWCVYISRVEFTISYYYVHECVLLVLDISCSNGGDISHFLKVSRYESSTCTTMVDRRRRRKSDARYYDRPGVYYDVITVFANRSVGYRRFGIQHIIYYYTRLYNVNRYINEWNCVTTNYIIIINVTIE